MTWCRGTLRPAHTAPDTGEQFDTVAVVGSATVEQILSGRLDTAHEYDQDDDEWVVVLSGGAVLTVGDVRVALGPGEWLLLPAHVRHRVVEVEPGTSWLAVRAPVSDRSG